MYNGAQALELKCWHTDFAVLLAADTASLATWFLFGKLIGVAMLVCFGEKRCRKNLPLCATSQPKPLFQMSSLQLGSDRSLPVHEASLESFDGAAFVDLSPISSLSLKERSLELQWLADELSGGLANLAQYFEIDPVYYHGIPCVGAALWHPAFMCREWIELMDDLLGKSSFPDTWSVHCGIQTLDTPADEYDLEADAPIINFSFLFNRSSGLVIDEISTADFLIWFNEPGIVPLSFP